MHVGKNVFLATVIYAYFHFRRIYAYHDGHNGVICIHMYETCLSYVGSIWDASATNLYHENSVLA